MTPKEQAESMIWFAENQGFEGSQAIQAAMFAVDKIINYGQCDRVYERFWFEVMDELECL